MNITDIKDSSIAIPTTGELILEGIFKRQTELHEKYKHVEFSNNLGLGLTQGREFSIDDKDWQYLLKDFGWRITEELTEALEADLEGGKLHCLEEIIDALHFYTEMLIICGYSSKDVSIPVYQNASKDILGPIFFVGLACNLLKNKPWKLTHLITDKKRFKEYLISGYIAVLELAMAKGLQDLGGVYLVYMKKNLINQFRIESNY